MPATRLWDVRAALVDLFTTALADPTWAVTDGVPARRATPKHFVLVGTDGGDTGTGEGSEDTSTATLVRSEISVTAARAETGRVVCAVWRWSGSPADMPTLRADVKAAIDVAAEAVNTDPALGGVLADSDGGAFVSGVRITEQQTQAGPFVRGAFDVSYDALLFT